MQTLKNHLFKSIALNDLNFPLQISDYYEQDMSLNELMEAITEGINTAEIIYYFKAMKYLSEHDNSLTLSIELASEYGIETDNINSELLATILYQHTLRLELYDIEDKINEILKQ